MTAAPCRRSAIRAATRGAGIPQWSSDIRPVRGHCKGGTKRKPCPSRWAVVRVSIDFRDASRLDRLATLECARCGRTWRRISAPPIRSEAGYQAVRLTLILPATAKRWYSRGHWHRTGDDALVLRDADLSEASDAIRDYRKRQDARYASRERSKVKREAEDAAATASFQATLARLDERDAREREQAAEEQAAREREAAYE